MTQGTGSQEIPAEVPVPAVEPNSPARLAGYARRWTERAAEALQQWATPATNPFLQRAVRTESRRHKPFSTLLGVALLAFTLNAAAWRLWLFFVENNRLLGRRYGGLTDPARLPEALGGNVIGFTALLTAASCTYGVLWAARARAAYLLRHELLKSTLDGLQQLPIAEERWLWMMSAHPTALSILIGLLGLPVYAMAWWMGQWSPLDIIGLFVLFAILGHAAPVWKPLLWKQQTARKSGRGFDWKQWHETLKQAQHEAQQVAADQSLDPLERQRRFQRVLSGATDDSSSPASTPTEMDAKNGKPAANTTVVFWGNANNSGWGSFTFIWVAVQLFTLSLGPLMGGGILTSLRGHLSETLPPGVINLLPGFIVTWPLMAARTLFSPLPFFGFMLPPVVLVLPFWIGVTHQSFTGLAASVSPVETFWTQPRLQRRKRIGTALWIATFAFIFGYGWPLLITGGELSRLLPGVPLTADWALAVAWTIAIVLGTLVAGIGMEAPFKRAGNGGMSQAEAWQKAGSTVALSLGGAIVLYFVFCWLGGMTGISPAWMQRVLATVAVSGAFLLADFGSAALGATLPPLIRNVWGPLRLLWFHGLALAALGLLIYARSLDAPFPATTAAPVFLSPFTTLFSLFRPQLAVPLEVWKGVLIQTILGAAFLLIAARTAFAPAAAGDAADAAVVTGRILQLLTALTTPLRALARVLRAMFLAILSAFQRLGQYLGNWNEAIIRRGTAYDNAILTAELRRRVPREYWPAQWIIVGLAASGVFALAAFNAWQESSATPQFSWHDWARTAMASILIVAWGLACLAVSGLGQSFDRERLNGTMVFVFLTPMTDTAILTGKLIPTLLYTSGFLLCAIPLLVICCAISIAGGLAGEVATAISSVTAIGTILLFAACLQLLFGVRAVKPTEGTAKAILWLAPVQAAGWAVLLICYNFGVWWVVGALVALTLSHLGLAYLCWRLALWSLRRQRYGDVAAGGKMAS